MLGNFRYMVVCESVSRSTQSRQYSIRNVVDEIVVSPGSSCELYLNFSAIVGPGLGGKTIVIRLEEPPLGQGRQQTILQFRAKERKGVGPWVVGKPFKFAPTAAGFAMLYAVDVDGAFGPAETVLSTFKFFVKLKLKKRSPVV